MVVLSMKKVLVLKGSKKVLVKTVSTIAQINSIVERFKNKGYTIKVYNKGVKNGQESVYGIN